VIFVAADRESPDVQLCIFEGRFDECYDSFRAFAIKVMTSPCRADHEPLHRRPAGTARLPCRFRGRIRTNSADRCATPGRRPGCREAATTWARRVSPSAAVHHHGAHQSRDEGCKPLVLTAIPDPFTVSLTRKEATR